MSINTNFDVVSGMATTEEKKTIKNFQEADRADYRSATTIKDTKRAKRCLETILDNYPNFRFNRFRKPLMDIVEGHNNSLQREYFKDIKSQIKEGYKIQYVLKGGYNRLYYPNQIRAGDLCLTGGYGILLPNGHKFDMLVSKLSYGHEVTGLDELLLQLSYINGKVRHYLRTLDPNNRDTFFMRAPVFEIYKGNVMQLDDFISGKLPAACFEKSLSLAIVLSSDSSLKRLKIKSYLTLGYMLVRDKQDISKWSRHNGSGYHAWVRLDVPKTAEGFGLKAGSYILDPSGNEVYALSNKTKSGSKKYISFERDTMRKLNYLKIYRPKKM